jgi:hypothetical protein
MVQMDEEKQRIRQWVVVGVVVGVVGDLAYASAIAPLPLPNRARMLLGFSFGPLITLAFVGLYHFFMLHRNSVLLQVSTLYAMIAGTIVNVMIVVQSAIFTSVPPDARAELGLAWDGINMVQLGLDVSWDIYFSLAMILLGIVMLNHPRFGIAWGGLSILIGAGLLLLNLATFPIPPAAAGYLDLGSVSGIFFLFVSLRVALSMDWVDDKLGL